MMPQRLGELLVAEKMITGEQLEGAVETQCLYGGRLGTSLIELGYLDEVEIAKTLSRKLHLPYIEPDFLMKIPPEVISLVPQKLAWKHLVIPVRLEKKRLYLAMSDPTNLTIIDTLAFRLGFIIVPVVVPEIRLMLALQKYYQLELSPRFHALSHNLANLRHKPMAKKKNKRVKRDKAPDTAKTKDKNKLKFESVAESKETIFEVSDDDILSNEEVAEEEWPLLGEQESLCSLSDEEYQELINMPEHLRNFADEDESKPGADRRVTLEVAKLNAEEQQPFTLLRTALKDAQNREDIADAIIDYLAAQSSGAALMMVKGGEATGWKACLNGEPVSDFDQLSIPLEQPSILHVVSKSEAHYLGPLPKEANNIMLSSYFSHQLPEMVLLLPLMLRNRLVTLLYLHEVGEESQIKLPEYQKMLDRAAMAFEMLILKNKIQMG